MRIYLKDHHTNLDWHLNSLTQKQSIVILINTLIKLVFNYARSSTEVLLSLLQVDKTRHSSEHVNQTNELPGLFYVE